MIIFRLIDHQKWLIDPVKTWIKPADPGIPMGQWSHPNGSYYEWSPNDEPKAFATNLASKISPEKSQISVLEHDNGAEIDDLPRTKMVIVGNCSKKPESNGFHGDLSTHWALLYQLAWRWSTRGQLDREVFWVGGFCGFSPSQKYVYVCPCLKPM